MGLGGFWSICIIGGGLVGAGTAWGVNVIPGAGQMAYGSAIAGGAIGGGLLYTWTQLDNWMWSESSGEGGQNCGSLFTNPCNAQ